MAVSVSIGIDIGGTNLKGAAVDRNGHILARHVRPTQLTREPRSVVNDMVDLVDDLLARASVDRSALCGVGVGSPGPLSVRRGRIIRAANLPGWEDVALRDMLCHKLDTTVVIENDGNAAAYGEYWVGAGRESEDLVLLTLGTGVGAGVIQDGQVLHGHFENAAELGHMIVVPGGLPCACGQRGCLEQYCSARSVARRVIAAIRSGEPSELSAGLQADTTIDARLVADSARQGDPLCLRIWNEACLYLAVACVNIQHAFNPARVLLGGGMSQAGDFLLDGVKQRFADQKWSLHDDYPEIALAGLGYDAGVIGAAGLVWREVT